MQSENDTQTLKEMGFNDDQIVCATKHSENKSLEGYVAWIEANPNLESFM
jgi:hypothetical protein